MTTTHIPGVLGIITARGGSKSIMKKSIALCAGRPLLEYTIEAALRSTTITRLIISTDDEEIAIVADAMGVEVPFMRPSRLAADDTPDLPVFMYTLARLEQKERYVPEAVVHLRPTTPLKKAADIDRGVALLLEDDDAESVRSVCSPLHTPFKMYRQLEGKPYLEPILRKEFPEIFEKFPEPYNMPRQSLPGVLRHSGYVDVIRPRVIANGSMSGTNIVPLPFEEWRDVDIDTARDLTYAELVIRELAAQGQQPWD